MSFKTDRLFYFIKILSIVGIILAIYLLVEQITQSPFRPCNINSVVSCNAIISGAVAKTFGIRTPLYGLIGYIGIFLAAGFKKKKTLIGIATFGLLFCLSIAYIELFKLHVICLVCIACQIVMISIFSLAVIINKGSNE
jgi:uncharacterized membrane protein